MNPTDASTEMLIRTPVPVVFDAFVSPRTIEKFWLKSASEPLAKGALVEWEFMVPGARDTVTVTDFVQDRLIAFRWSDGIAVRMTFASQGTDGTRLTITASGFSVAEAASQAVIATEGFAIVLCDLKSLLETGQTGNMVRDRAALISADMADA